MDYTDTDPYASYDPLSDGLDLEDSFEFYDEGIDPYTDDAVYFADGEVPSQEYDYEYEELYDGPILEEEPLYTDDWLPLPPEAIPVESIPLADRPPEYGTELYIGGLQHPDPAEIRESYCQLYPEACLEGQGLSGREPYNSTEAAEEMSRTLRDVDLTGVAIAALLLLVLLFGLHYGGESSPSGGDAPSDRPRKDPSSGPKDETAERKSYDDQLKAGGMDDESKRKKKVDEIMAEPDKKKRQEKVNNNIRPFYDKQLKDAGWKDDKERQDTVDKIMRLPADKRAEALEKYKKRKSGSPAPPNASTETGKTDKPDGPEASEKQPTAGDAGTSKKPSSSGRPSADDVKAAGDMLKAAGVKDDDKQTLAKQVAKLDKGKRDAEMKRLKAEQDTAKGKRDAERQKAKDQQELDTYVEQLKKAGYGDDEAKKHAADIMKLDKDARRPKLEELVKAKKKKTATEVPPNRAPKAALRDDDITKKLAAAGFDDKGQKDGIKKVKGKATPEEQQKELDRIIAKGPPSSGASPETAAKGEAAKERDGYVKRLKDAGYDDAESGRLADEVMKRPKERRDKKLAEYEKAGPKAKANASQPGAPPADNQKKQDPPAGNGGDNKPGAPGAPPPDDKGKKAEPSAPGDPKAKSDDEIVKQLNDKGYTEPALQQKRLKDIRSKGGPKEQKAELDRLLKKPSDAVQKENDQYKAAREREEKKKAKQAGAPQQDGGGAPTGDNPGTNTAPADPPNSTDKPPQNKKELEAKLKEMGFSDPAIAGMVKEFEGADPARQARLIKRFTDPKEKDAHESKYGKGASASDGPATAPSNNRQNAESKADPSKLPTSDKVKERLTRKYKDPAVVQKMMDAYDKAPDDKAKAALYNELMADTKKKDNLKKYGPAPPADAANGTEPNAADPKPGAGQVAGMSEPDLHKLLEGKGYTDPEARAEIIDKLKSDKPGDQEGQKKKLMDEYVNRSPRSRAKLNKELGDQRRAAKKSDEPTTSNPADPGGSNTDEKDIPDDAELDKRLKNAKWDNDNARKQAIERIKAGETPEKRLKLLKDHLKDGAASPERMKKYAKDWEKTHPSGSQDGSTPGGTIAAMTPDDKKRIDKLLDDKKYDPDARKSLIDELEKMDPKKRDGKLKDWLNDTPENIKRRSKDRAAKEKAKNGQDPNVAPSEDPGGGSQRKKRQGEGSDNDPKPGGRRGEGSSSSAYPYWILALLLIPLLFALSRGDMTMPSGRLPVALPTLPSFGSAWAPRAPWLAKEVEVLPKGPKGPKINRGLPDITRKKTSKSVSSPRIVARSAGRQAESNPSININNVNAQGENIPIDIRSGGSGRGVPAEAVIEETVVTEIMEESGPVAETIVEEIVQETVLEGPVIESVPGEVLTEEIVIEEPIEKVILAGQSDPDRLFWMLVAAAVILIPLALDAMSDWPLREAIDTEYLSVPVHWLILIAAAIFIYTKVDRTYQWSARYGRPLIYHTKQIVQGTDGIVWTVALFGESQSMLGLAIVAGVFALMTIWEPFHSDLGQTPSEGVGQMAGLLGLIGTALLLLNA